MFSQSQKISALSLGVLLMLACASFVFAQSDVSSSTATSSQDVATSTILVASSTPVVPQTPAVKKALVIPPAPANLKALDAGAQTRITNLAANISNRAEAYVKRLGIITTRIESRMRKMEQEGYDMSDTRFYTDEARSALSDATNEMLTIDLDVNQFVTAASYWEAWIEVRQVFTETRAHLERAKSLLQSAISEMKLTKEEGIPPTPAAVAPEVATSSASSTLTQ